MEVDFPNGKEQTAEIKKQNDSLSKEFAVEAFPTLMLCDAEGRPYAEAGFPSEMTTKSMLETLDTQKKIRLERDEAFAKAEKAEGVERAKLLVAALELVPASAVPIAYASTIDEIAKLDPEDKTGYVKAARSAKALTELEGGFGELMQAGKTDEALKFIDKFLDEQKPEGESKQKALLFKVFGFAAKESMEEAMKTADEILKIDGGTQTAAMVKQIKGQLESQQK